MSIIEVIAEDIASQYQGSVPVDAIELVIQNYIDEIKEEVEARLKDDYDLEIEYEDE